MKAKQVAKDKIEYFDLIPRDEFEKSEASELYPHSVYKLSDLITFAKSKGWTDLSKVRIGSNNFPRSNDTYIYIEASIPKTETEIQEEKEKISKQEIAEEEAYLKRKANREAKKKTKQALLQKLSPEEKKLLGL